MATLRERVERQRSVNSSNNNCSESNSLEGLNLERGDSHHSHSKGKSIERLDSTVSTLHQDVAALSMEVSFSSCARLSLFVIQVETNDNALFIQSNEIVTRFHISLYICQVRNAIQALQEMTYSTIQSQMDLGGRFPPARSIPNLPNEMCSIVGQSTDSYALARCSSHPAEMWGREVLEHQALCDSPENMRAIKSIAAASVGVCEATQTDTGIDIMAIEKFVVSNPRLILNMLGILEPAIQVECDLQPQTLIPIPEADTSSPEVSSPHENNASATDYAYTAVGSRSTPWSPQNSSNRIGDNSRSTDALLGHSSDDCLKASDTSLPDTVNFSIIKEGSFKGKRRKLQQTAADVTRSGKSSGSNSSTSTTATTPRGSSADLLARHGSGNSVTFNRKQSGRKAPTHTVVDHRASADTSDEGHPDYDELSEKCALLCNDVRKNSRSSTTDIQKRSHLSMPRPPFNYRFSAGDADKLEKGIRHIPSTRSLKESWIHIVCVIDKS